jgi:hypothetical protein
MDILKRSYRFIGAVSVILLCGCATPTISKNLLVMPFAETDNQFSQVRQAYTIGGKGADWGSDILCRDDRTGCVVFGYTIKSFGESTDMLAVKLLPSWQPVWAKTYGGTHKDVLFKTIATRDGGYLLLGESQSMFNTPLRAFSTSYPSPRPLLVKIDVSGNVQWARIVCCDSHGIYETTDGSFLVVGRLHRMQQNKTYKTDIILTKLAADGKAIWSKTYDLGHNDFSTTVTEAHDGGILIGGADQIAGADNDAFLLKLTADGQPVWAKKYECEKDQGVFSLIETDDTGWLVMGPHHESDQNKSIHLMSISSNGDVRWANAYNSSGYADTGIAMIRGYEHSYLIVGRSDGNKAAMTSEKDTKGAVLLVNEKGEVIASKHIALSTALMSAAKFGNGEYVVTGTYVGRTGGGPNSLFTAFWQPVLINKSGSPFASVPIMLNAKSITVTSGVWPSEDTFIQNLDVQDLQVTRDQAPTGVSSAVQ